MAKPQEIEEIEEKVILVGVSEQEGDDAEDSVTELAELVKTAGATVVGTLIQKRETIHPGTYVGTGKVEEIAQLIAQTGATGIVCDDELSPAQLRNLENMLDTKVMDRTLIILDIFAARATTSEGKIQVELAQLKYRLSRLSGLGKTMSRLGGGIGTRGPGEKKLEIDRRLINDRIAHPAGGEAEVAVENVPQVVHKLNRNRFVKTVFGLERGDNCITFGFFRTERACRNGMHDKKGDGDDQKDGQQCHQEPFQQVCKKLIVHLYAPQVPFAKNFLLIILGRQQFVKSEFSVLPQ